jgi:hypothetical protein
MKPMHGLNLSKFKKVHTDGFHTTFKNDKGAEIKIAHAGLAPHHLKQMEAIPLCSGGSVQHYYDGANSVEPKDAPAPLPSGEHLTPEQSEPLMTPVDAPAEQPSKMYTPSGAETADATMTGQQPGDLSYQGTASAQAPNSTPAGPSEKTADETIPGAGAPLDTQGKPGNDFKLPPGYVDQGEALREHGAAGKDIASKVQDTEKKIAGYKEQEAQVHLNKATEIAQSQQASNAENQQIVDEIRNNQIRPEAYLEDMGTGRKIRTAIGLILGGMSGGYNHTDNPALTFLHQQIQNSVEAQKANQSNRLTLLNANMARYKDEQVAINMTTAQLAAHYADRIDSESHNFNSATSQSAAKQAYSVMKMKEAAEVNAGVTRMAALKNLQKTGGIGETPMSLAAAGLIPQEAAAKEQAIYDKGVKFRDIARDLYSQAAQLTSIKGIRNDPVAYANRIDSINASIMSLAMKGYDIKRLGPGVLEKMMNPKLIGIKDRNTDVLAKMHGVMNDFALTSEPMPYFNSAAPKGMPLYPYMLGNQPKVGDIPLDQQGNPVKDQQGNPVQYVNPSGQTHSKGRQTHSKGIR